MDKVTLPTGLGLEADPRAPRLERLAVRTRRNLPELPCGRKPYFDVVGFCGSEAHIAGAEQDGAVVKSELLQNGFRVADQRLVLLVACFGRRKFEEFHFLELLLALNAARVLSGCSCFAAKTRGPRSDVNGEFFLRQSFIAIQIVQFDFAGRR